jgi:MOSC domain-containing protein YiiM
MPEYGKECMGKVIAVSISTEKGTRKTPVKSAEFVEDWGIRGDAHAGKWHRQVSLLSYGPFEEFRKKGAPITPGAFGENLLVEGYDFKTLPVGTKFRCGEVILELTQVGKKCHSGCEIFKLMGDCIMPREGVFTRVLRGGTISEGDELTILETDADGS